MRLRDRNLLLIAHEDVLATRRQLIHILGGEMPAFLMRVLRSLRL